MQSKKQPLVSAVGAPTSFQLFILSEDISVDPAYNSSHNKIADVDVDCKTGKANWRAVGNFYHHRSKNKSSSSSSLLIPEGRPATFTSHFLFIAQRVALEDLSSSFHTREQMEALVRFIQRFNVEWVTQVQGKDETVINKKLVRQLAEKTSSELTANLTGNVLSSSKEPKECYINDDQEAKICEGGESSSSPRSSLRERLETFIAWYCQENLAEVNSIIQRTSPPPQQQTHHQQFTKKLTANPNDHDEEEGGKNVSTTKVVNENEKQQEKKPLLCAEEVFKRLESKYGPESDIPAVILKQLCVSTLTQVPASSSSNGRDDKNHEVDGKREEELEINQGRYPHHVTFFSSHEKGLKWLSNFFLTLIYDPLHHCIGLSSEALYVAFKARFEQVPESVIQKDVLCQVDSKTVKSYGHEFMRNAQPPEQEDEEEKNKKMMMTTSRNFGLQRATEMKRILFLKFRQNPELGALLVNTGIVHGVTGANGDRPVLGEMC